MGKKYKLMDKYINMISHNALTEVIRFRLETN